MTPHDEERLRAMRERHSERVAARGWIFGDLTNKLIDNIPYLTEDLVPRLMAEIARLNGIVGQVDEILVVNWVGPRVDGDYRKALADLVTSAIQIENDPAVSETAKARLDQIAASGRAALLEAADIIAFELIGGGPRSPVTTMMRIESELRRRAEEKRK